MATVLLDHPVPLLHQHPGQNDCGPHAAAMAAGFYSPALADPTSLAAEMRLLRVPSLGATLPWAIGRAIRRHGLTARGGLLNGGWFNSLDAIRSDIGANHPVVVLVRPTDLPRCPWYALHYRVAVGFEDDPALPGGGILHFNCSATLAPARDVGHHECSAGSERVGSSLGNLSVDYATFLSQWRSYLTINWALAVLLRD